MKKNYIIKKHDDFNNIINKGNRVSGKIITLYYYPSEDGKSYFGFAVGKKSGNAVTRNKIKRKIRMVVHNYQNLFSKKFKYIIMLKKDCLSFKHEEWEKEMVDLIGKVNNNEKN